MKKLLIVIILIFSLICVKDTIACSIDSRPHFTVKTPNIDKCFFQSYEENLSSDIDVVNFIQNKTQGSNYINCDNLVLDEGEQEFFRDIINQLNKERYFFSGIIIEKQSDTEYLNFQKLVEKVNADKCDCEKFDNIKRYDSWTSYVISDDDCGHDTTCQPIPPEGCFNRMTYYTFWSNPILMLILIFAVPIVIIAGIIFLISKVYKKTKRER